MRNNRQIRININTANAAFGENDQEQAEQVAYILQRAIEKIENEGINRFTLFDINGNRVGQFTYDYA